MEVRRATPEELRYDGEPLNLANDFKDILMRGHVIDTFSSGGGTRVVRIFENRESRDGNFLLGYGDDANVENALRRARDTYRRREAEGDEYLVPDKYPERSSGLLTGGHNTSALDNITWNQGFRAYQEGEEVIVWTQWGRNSDEPWEGRGTNLEAAADNLSVKWMAA